AADDDRRGALSGLVPPGGRQALRLALAQPARHDLAREAHLLRHPLDREHGARVARRQLPALELRLDRVREAEQPQRVRDRRPALPHPLGQLVLREPALVDQVAVRLRFLQRGVGAVRSASRPLPSDLRMLLSIQAGCPVVALPGGSRTRVGWSRSASADARSMTVAAFPTLPFRFATAITRRAV